MKKFLILFLLGGIYQNSSSQSMQASLGPGTMANRVKIYLKPSATQTPANISTLQFNIGIATTITPKPVMTVMSTTLTGVTWTITEAEEGGYNNYQLTTATSPIQPNTTQNTEFEVMEVMFTDGPVTSENVALVTLPDGGAGASVGNSLFLCTGSLTSDGSNLYYERTGVSLSNSFSYDEASPGFPPGTSTSSAMISGVSLPIKIIDFSVYKQSNSALVNWKIMDDDNIDHYELERSKNGKDFTGISSISKTTGSGSKTYTYNDINLNTVNSNIVYYRIKQIDKSGAFTYTDVRSLRLDLTGKVSVYPNPVKEGFNLMVPFKGNTQGFVQLSLQNAAGQLVERKQISAVGR